MRSEGLGCQRFFPSLTVRIRFFCLVILLPVGILTACRSPSRTRDSDLVQVEVRGVSFDPTVNSPVIVLQDQDRTRAIPIWVGMLEAQAIHLQLEGRSVPRPMTHDLLKNILEKVGVGLEKVVVTELKDNTYYAFIYLANGTKTLQVDSRPSDAIALALRFRRPIFVEKGLFDVAVPGKTPAKLAPVNFIAEE
ncbi:MAG: bifunctional nuclease family protein [Candidatus Binatia bacterium]